MKKKYNKLVRDRIPEIIEQDGKRAAFRYLEEDEVIAQLFNKLSEETAELQDTQNVEEIADVIEVLLTLAKLWGYDDKEILNHVYRKRLEKGGFRKGLFLIDVTK